MDAPTPPSNDRSAALSGARSGLLAIGLAAAAAIFLGLDAAPAGEPGLDLRARNLAIVFVIAVTFWVTEAMPIAVTSLAAVALLPLMGVSSMRTAVQNMMGPVFIFVLVMFILAGVIQRSGIDRRFALALLSRAGTSPARVLFAFMVGTAALSSIVSDVPACAIFMALGLGVLDRMGARPGESRFGAALMMAIPIAALIGGVATPAGSSINILGLDQIRDFAERHDLDLPVSFVQWMAIGVPMVLVLIPTAWWVLLRCFPPDVATVGSTAEIEAERRELGPLSGQERKVVLLLGTMGAAWIAGSWVPWLDVVLVATVGAIVAFAPGVRLLEWREAERIIGWETLLMIGGVTALGKASMETGLASWLVQGSLGTLQDWSATPLVALVSAVTVIIHLPLPIAPIVNSVLIPPVAELALHGETGAVIFPPALLALPVAFTASCAFLLPLDAVCLLTYAKGYYRMHDMLLPGFLISIVWVVWITVLMRFVAPLVGLV